MRQAVILARKAACGRDWLISHQLDGVSPEARLPAEIVSKTEALYRLCCEKITGKAFPAG